MDYYNIFLIRTQDVPCIEPKTFTYKETILWNGIASDVPDYLSGGCTGHIALGNNKEARSLANEIHRLLKEEKHRFDQIDTEQLTSLADAVRSIKEMDGGQYSLFVD
ncbi:hypothetical protein [Synechococcus sp. RS9907]|uniref:hypothetical protein n=1 Tax=Synechococcus sp. RS9907 TaxID=221350 RepID=UPI00165DE75F|nr:hypothetical protein [Synechococcus sp. RS9907]